MDYYALAYYLFVPVENPEAEVQAHKKFFKNRDVTGRIYISHEGYNGQMSGSMADAEAYMQWFRAKYPQVAFKIHHIKENIFPRMTVKKRNQLVALNETCDVRQGGEHVSPEEWKHMLESGEPYFLLDVRNRYEWEVGHFEGAVLPPLEQFRDFPAYADALQKALPPDTRVMMYCTGGIRCELYSALLKNRGFSSVYQLDGGVIGYGLQVGQEHWKGKLFVFDDRLAISIDGQEVEPISTCRHCQAPSDIYYNCANMDCNELFLACPACTEVYVGCCSSACTQAPRLRPFNVNHKPFRKKHLCETCGSS